MGAKESEFKTGWKGQLAHGIQARVRGMTEAAAAIQKGAI